MHATETFTIKKRGNPVEKKWQPMTTNNLAKEEVDSYVVLKNLKQNAPSQTVESVQFVSISFESPTRSHAVERSFAKLVLSTGMKLKRNAQLATRKTFLFSWTKVINNLSTV